jgi:hypothetical protein
LSSAVMGIGLSEDNVINAKQRGGRMAVLY